MVRRVGNFIEPTDSFNEMFYENFNGFQGMRCGDNTDNCTTLRIFQECIKPVKIDRLPGKVGKIQIEDDGSYMQIDQVMTF